MPISHWRKNFLPHVRYVATIPCESVRHKSNTFHTILALCTGLYRLHLRKPVSMKQTKHRRKSETQNLCSKCPPFTRTHAFKRHTPLRNRCRDNGVVQQPPPPQQTLFLLLHVMDPRTVDPLLKDTPDAVVHWIQIWRIGWPRVWKDKLLASLCSMVTGHVHGEWNDFSDVNITSPGKGCTWRTVVVNLPVCLVFICKVMYQKS